MERRHGKHFRKTKVAGGSMRNLCKSMGKVHKYKGTGVYYDDD